MYACTSHPAEKRRQYGGSRSDATPSIIKGEYGHPQQKVTDSFNVARRIACRCTAIHHIQRGQGCSQAMKKILEVTFPSQTMRKLSQRNSANTCSQSHPKRVLFHAHVHQLKCTASAHTRLSLHISTAADSS